MRNYEVTFIVDPVLSSDEIKGTARTYEDLIKDGGGKIVHMDEMGLRQLAYPINRRSSGIYYSVEFEIENGSIIQNLELSMRRDERIMRFLTAALDKYGVQYNADKRDGKIGTITKKDKKDKKDKRDSRGPSKSNSSSKSSTPTKTVAPTKAIAESKTSALGPVPTDPKVPPAKAKADVKGEEE